jgi:hypothetical protein
MYFIAPEGKVKGKALGVLSDEVLKIMAGPQYQPTTAEGKQAKAYAALLLTRAPSAI